MNILFRYARSDVRPGAYIFAKTINTYNQNSGIATKVRNGSTTSYAYVSGTHKLSTAGSGSFTYDAKGNVTSDGYSSVTLTSYDFRNLPLAITASSTNYTYKYNDGGNHAIGRQAVFIKKEVQQKITIFTTIPAEPS